MVGIRAGCNKHLIQFMYIRSRWHEVACCCPQFDAATWCFAGNMCHGMVLNRVLRSETLEIVTRDNLKSEI